MWRGNSMVWLRAINVVTVTMLRSRSESPRRLQRPSWIVVVAYLSSAGDTRLISLEVNVAGFAAALPRA
jgi:hypothetical protein